MTAPTGYTLIAGLNVPDDVAPTLLAAVRTIYASVVEGLSDEDAFLAVTKAVMADVLDRYAVWVSATSMQTDVAPLQQAVTDAQIANQQATVAARAAAVDAAARILAPGS